MPASIPAPKLTIPLEPLTPNGFAAFGTVIENPSSSPSTNRYAPAPVTANQGTATKFPSISSLNNHYHLAPSRKPAAAAINLFVCKPRSLHSPTNLTDGTQLLDVRVLERHPFTPQTFAPLGARSTSQSPPAYVVVVAPTLPVSRALRDSSKKSGVRPPPYPTPERRRRPRRSVLDVFSRARPSPFNNEAAPPPPVATQGATAVPLAPGMKIKGAGLPDLKNVRAFLARGDQAVTYGPGTWHAPMCVVGEGEVTFVVVQWENGVAGEDCQEVELKRENDGAGGEGISVDVGTGVEGGDGMGGSVKAKL